MAGSKEGLTFRKQLKTTSTTNNYGKRNYICRSFWK